MKSMSMLVCVVLSPQGSTQVKEGEETQLPSYTVITPMALESAHTLIYTRTKPPTLLSLLGTIPLGRKDDQGHANHALRSDLAQGELWLRGLLCSFLHGPLCRASGPQLRCICWNHWIRTYPVFTRVVKSPRMIFINFTHMPKYSLKF